MLSHLQPRVAVILGFIVGLFQLQLFAQTNVQASNEFSFMVAGDMRQFTGPAPAGKRYFDGACEAMKLAGPSAFLLSPGDCDPPAPIRAVMDKFLGTNYLWYPVVGNHDIEKRENMDWLRKWAKQGIPGLVRQGPVGAELTTYSFDYGNAHFIALNGYYNGRTDTTRADELPEAALDWLSLDLKANRQPLIFIFGHKPIQSLPDMDSGRLRHPNDSVSTNKVRLEQVLKLLKDYHVRAYICGHTHSTSVAKVKGIWQADSGHSRGGGDPGAPSSFLKVRVSGLQTWVDVYRADQNGENYQVKKTVELD